MMKQNFRSKPIKCSLVLSIIIFLFSFFTACNNDQNIFLPPPEVSALSVTHASPDAPDVDIYIGNTLVSQFVPYLGTLPYIDVLPGLNQIVITVANTTTVLIDTTVFFQQNLLYSIFVLDSISHIRPLVLTDDIYYPASGNSNIRFINLSPNSPTVDIQAQGKATPWFSFYSFPHASNFIYVTEGTYNIDMNLAGSPTILVTFTDVSLTSGYIYTLILNGFYEGSGVQALGLTLITNYPFQR